MIFLTILKSSPTIARRLQPFIAPKPALQRTLATPLAFLPPRRHYAARTSADAAVEELQELYATAKDELEIAHSETTNNTIYAADDRAAARAELTRLKDAFAVAVREAGDEELGKEITRRVGHRVRELERGVEAMEEMAREG